MPTQPQHTAEPITGSRYCQITPRRLPGRRRSEGPRRCTCASVTVSRTQRSLPRSAPAHQRVESWPTRRAPVPSAPGVVTTYGASSKRHLAAAFLVDLDTPAAPAAPHHDRATVGERPNPRLSKIFHPLDTSGGHRIHPTGTVPAIRTTKCADVPSPVPSDRCARQEAASPKFDLASAPEVY